MIFRSPLVFLNAVERVNNEKDTLNNSVEWSGFLGKSYIYILRIIRSRLMSY